MMLWLWLSRHWLSLIVVLGVIVLVFLAGRSTYMDNQDLREEQEFKLDCLVKRHFPVQMETRGPIVCYNKNGKVVSTHG